MKAIIDPRLRLPYYTYILQGLVDEGFTLEFAPLDAPDGDGMAMRIGGRRIWVDTRDPPQIDPNAYEWCDVFGKVNCTDQDVETHDKIRLLGPVFGIRLWNLPAGYPRLRHFVGHGVNLRTALGYIRFQGITRLPIADYVPGASEAGFVFHRSRAWSGRWAQTNGPRERFIEALESTPISTDVTLAEDRIPLRDYLEFTKRSVLVFNCPAVLGCLGWKLGEYLALGKAIVSTPLGRSLPEPLVHGEHIHFVADDVTAMREAILEVNANHEYCRHLERGAREWYERNMQPSVGARRLLEA